MSGFGDVEDGDWEAEAAGVLRLPSGRLVRGRGLRRPLEPSAPTPTYTVCLLGKEPPRVPWETRWIRWPDFWLPRDRAYAREVLTEAWNRAAVPAERVEIACGGGRGRTGTALACLAVLDGVPADEAVDFVRRNYDRHAVETPWQRRYVRRFAEPSRVRRGAG
ncbi:protein phosphatase [Streptomyces sp. NPDC006365]|uniref:protein-tyrosine phosphatase family protein n=1 Tax=Streptomyces sp. NPDC006365 TaxID=3364744 RepID=UPI0036CAAD86